MRLSELTRDLTLRFDTKAIKLYSATDRIRKDTIPLEAIADIRDMLPCEKPDDPFHYHEIASVDEFGLGEPYLIDESNIEQGSEEERILSKVEKGDIASANMGSILIPKVRPHLGKFVFVKKEIKTYFTTAFLEAIPKNISSQLLYCILKHPAIIKQISLISRIGKGYPTISAFDLARFVRIPIMLLKIESEIDMKVKFEIDKLFDVLLGRRKEREIIDTIFEKHLSYKTPKRGPIRSFIFFRSGLTSSFDMRLSTHFIRPESKEILDIFHNMKTVKINRLCSLPISLGVSPELFLDESKYYYLGPQAMTSERLSPEKLNMISLEFFNSMKSLFGVKRGDVFLRRSGASLGKVLHFDSNLPCIFSDFMMRIRFKVPSIGKYAAYWMRSTMFQMLVKTVAVIGKGLQNIYPYQVSLMPIPDIDKYNFNKIVEEIDHEISKNDNLQLQVKKSIENLEKRLTQDLTFTILDKV